MNFISVRDNKHSNYFLVAFLAILLAYVLLAVTYSIVTPLFESPDELFHYPMVQYIATQWQLPVQPTSGDVEVGPWEQEGNQPPLYYILAALLTSNIDTQDMDTVRYLNPYAARGVAFPDNSNLNVVVHRPGTETFPWHGTALAIHLVRFFLVFCGSCSLYLTWQLIQELFPNRSGIALSATAIQAFTPMFIFISGSVNNDNLVILFCTLTLVYLVRLIKDPRQSILSFMPLGFAIGLAILSKESALALLPFAAVAALWTAWRSTQGSPIQILKGFAIRMLAWTLPVVLVAGWWYWRNFRLYGDWLGLNAFVNIVKPRVYPLTVAQLWSERHSFLTSYWGNFGWLNILMPFWIYLVLNILSIFAGIGFLLAFVEWIKRLRRLNNLAAARILVMGWPIAVVVSLIRWTSMTPASQGRLVFPAISLWSAGLVLGFLRWVPRPHLRVRRIVVSAIIAFLWGISVAAPGFWIGPAYRLPQALSEDELAAISNRLDVRFGDHLKLLGYELHTLQVSAGETVDLTLYWEALAPTATDHALFIHLLGEGERIVAQRDSFPGRGLLSTTWIEPGTTWSEDYLISLPPSAYAPDSLELAIGVYDVAQGTRLPISTTVGWVDNFRFANVILQPRDNTLIPNSITARFGEKMILEGYELSSFVVMPGNSLEVTLYWQCEREMEENYTVSLQLIDASWKKAAQSDSWPFNGDIPTTSWEAGQRLEETRVLSIVPDALPGVYTLEVVIYSLNGDGVLHHLPVVWQAHQYPEVTLQLTQIRVQ